MAELNLALTFDLHILAGTRIMVSVGPWQGEVLDFLHGACPAPGACIDFPHPVW